MLEELVDEISYIPTSMKSGTCFNISRRSLEKKTGQLLYLRSNINLVSHLLSPPDFYWDRPLLESIYTAVCNRQLDIESRTEVANNRLTHTGELLALLRENKHYQVAESLELAILVLIFVEIILEVYRHYQNL
ncbi:required for meiotic nuclear division protein 1 homolog [Zophobas morio]|uniref:required for meiotic nuclear division protein 1 homolog n=1 Tax=Zophobas morio TaxID=2755281 RepID=UPI003082AB57